MADKLDKGVRVKMLSDYSGRWGYEHCYPPLGTQGVVEYVCGDGDLLVLWDSGTNNLQEETKTSWYCGIEDVAVVE